MNTSNIKKQQGVGCKILIIACKMKKLLLLLIIPFLSFGQNVNIPDVNFKSYLVGSSSINTNDDDGSVEKKYLIK